MTSDIACALARGGLSVAALSWLRPGRARTMELGSTQVQRMASAAGSFSDPSSRSIQLAKLPSFLIATFVTLTTLAIFVPLNPDMPDKGIDPSWISAMREARGNLEQVMPLVKPDQSWMIAMNEAVARRLRFGKEIIFTFGPYASIHTRVFHPKTDRLMVYGSLLIGLSYVTALLYLAQGRNPYLLVILMLFLATFPSRDALLLSYAFLLVVCALSFASCDACTDANLRWWHVLAIIVMFSALGLLPLIKGSLLVPACLSQGMLCALLLYRFSGKQAITLLLVPVAATITFWTIAGQSLSDFPAYLRGTFLLTSGYTDAMSIPWIGWPNIMGYGFVVAYLTVAASIYVSMIRAVRLSVWSKWFLGLLCAPFLLIAFKHGFVRTDHLPIAFNSLVIIISIVGFLYKDRYLIGALLVSILLVVAIDFRQDPELIKQVRGEFGAGTVARQGGKTEILAFISRRAIGTLSRVTYKSAYSTYAEAWDGIRSRLADRDSLQNRFTRGMANLGGEYPLSTLEGSGDIYSYEQAVLLASNNVWNPRPILQSYSAYTPTLAELNERHLRGEKAPDWVLIDLWVPDGRLPSLDDGMSWPALLENYTFVSFDGQFVLMRRNQVLQTASRLSRISQERHQTGLIVALPEVDAPLFAEVDLKPTLLGKLLMVLFKPPQLNIKLNLKNGESTSYRVISNMMTTGFIVSPLVSNTQEFEYLAVGNRRFLDEHKVEGISIAPSYGGSVLWSGTYTLTLKAYHGQRVGGS